MPKPSVQSARQDSRVPYDKAALALVTAALSVPTVWLARRSARRVLQASSALSTSRRLRTAPLVTSPLEWRPSVILVRQDSRVPTRTRSRCVHCTTTPRVASRIALGARLARHASSRTRRSQCLVLRATMPTPLTLCASRVLSVTNARVVLSRRQSRAPQASTPPRLPVTVASRAPLATSALKTVRLARRYPVAGKAPVRVGTRASRSARPAPTVCSAEVNA